MDHHYLVREIILKYHRGEPLTAEEQALLDAEMAKLPADRIWERVRAHVEGGNRGKIRTLNAKWIAAASVVVLMISAGVYRYVGHKVTHYLMTWKVVAPGHFYQETEGPGGVEVLDSASGGQSAPYAVLLPDGSKVTLSYASSVRYKKDFDERKVTFSGQVNFDVAKDQRPFVVESGKTRVQVLATHFNWMHYPGIPDEITLLDGKVLLSRGGLQRELAPAERVVIHEGSPVRVQVRKLVRPEETVAWMRARPAVVFDSTELYVVVRRMAQYYNRDFRVDVALQSGKPVSGILELERPLADNLAPINDMLKEYDAHAEDKDGVIAVSQ